MFEAGNARVLTQNGSKFKPQLPLSRVAIEGAIWFAFAVGVCNNPDPLPDVRGANRASWNIKRPCGVAFALQVREYFVQARCLQGAHENREIARGLCDLDNIGLRSRIL